MGKVVQKSVEYLGKSLKLKNWTEQEEIAKYVFRPSGKRMGVKEIDEILKKTRMEYGA